MSAAPLVTAWFRAARICIVLGILAPLAMLGVAGFTLLELRREAWTKVELASRNLLQVMERDIARNIEMYDLSLRGVIDNLKVPGLADVSPELRQLVLFDRATTAQDLGVMLVIDEHGDSIIDADAVPARKANYADREYFQAHKVRPDLGLTISRPLVSRLTGLRMIALTRRIDKPDGSFGGVVLGTLKLSYFANRFDRLRFGKNGAINLYLRDGTRIMRYPYVEADTAQNVSGALNFERFLQEGSGSFVGTSVQDGIERYYAFTPVGNLPLILTVDLSTADVEAEWRPKALVIFLVAMTLCGLIIALSLLFGRELRRRAAIQAELANLSHTDVLTGLPNRRAFDETFARCFSGTLRTRQPLSLLIVDADYFKRFNDRYGHQVGDEVLQGLARALAASMRRPLDLVSRAGGEEFAILLPETDAAGAERVARTIHAAVSALTVVSAGLGAGAVTVSIGLACAGLDGDAETPERLYRRADAALYAAKQKGRNRTERASDPSAGCEWRKGALTVMAGGRASAR